MKIRQLITILSSALTLTCIAGCGKAGNMEAFTDVQAYRTAIDLDFVYLDEEDPAICVDPPGTGNPEELRQEAFKAYEMINDARASQDLAPLRWDAKLETYSYKRAEELLSRFDHVCPDGRSWFMVAQDTVLGENIYKGKKSADKVMESWMNNPTDKKNFMCDYFTKAAISIYEDDKNVCYWAILFGADTIDVSFYDNVEPASVWILADTDNNRHTSIWGTAMIKTDELGKEYNAGIPKADDDKYLFRMIDDDEMYYETQIPELKSGWKLNLHKQENALDPQLDVYDENGDLIQECSVFWAAL